ncbi:MAG: hypothetical protein BECKG1743E_GA0114224_107232 [Candidatus Kentron sp. G]|nr:MAG: hypothetical protein BECKG1743E_GA0114224_107232 [Candidatus Kentron sp. G]
MKKKYIVRLTEQERSFLKDVVKKGRGPAYKIIADGVPILPAPESY